MRKLGIKSLMTLAALAAATGVAGMAQAASVTGTVNNVAPSHIVSLSYNGNSLGIDAGGTRRCAGGRLATCAPRAAPPIGDARIQP